MAVKYVNRAKMSVSAVASSGTGDLTLDAAVSGYQTFADAGVSDGDQVRYVIEEGSAWEIGTGTYTATGTTLSRSVEESSNADAAITATTAAEVYVTAAADDILGFDNLYQADANTVEQRNGVNAQTLNVYNTYTDASNYERGTITWNSNILEVGTESAGTGSDRILRLKGDEIEMFQGPGAYFKFESGDMVLNFGARILGDVRAGVGAGSELLSFAKVEADLHGFELSYTVSTLPTPGHLAIATVEDSSSPTVGSTVSGGGSDNALVWYNGTNWIVIGV